jgi:hypothetical protein
MSIENILILANLTTSVTRYNERAALLRIALSPEFAASFLTDA